MIAYKKILGSLGVLVLLLAVTTSQVLAAATLTLSKSSGLPGVIITVSGSGFASSEKVTIRLSATILGTATTVSGAFSKSVTIPLTTVPGSYAISATGSTSGAIAVAAFTVLAPPSLTLSKSSGLPGTVITASGSGYASTETVTIKLGLTVLGTATTVSGAFSKSITIPLTTVPGAYTITATGATSGHVDSAPFKVLIAPTLTLSKGFGPPGAVITASGKGFATTEIVTIKLGLITLGTVTSINGAFAKSVTIPLTAVPGTFTMTATGATSLHADSAPFKVVPPSLTLTPTSGLPGILIKVSGKDYAATETVTIMFDTTAIGVAATTAGAFSMSVKIPATATVGVHTITGTGGTSKIVESAHFTVLAPITLTLSKSSGTPGTVIAVGGSGFASVEKVTIKLGLTVLGTATTSGGLFSTVVTIPLAELPGSFTMTATGATSLHVDQAPFKVLGVLTLTPNSGLAGSTVTVSGKGYAAIETVTIKFGSTIIATVTTVNGAFSKLVKIPATATIGTYTISATGGTSKVEDVGKFTVN